MRESAGMTVSDLILELRQIILVHPEAAQGVVEARNKKGVLTAHPVIRLKGKVLIIESGD